MLGEIYEQNFEADTEEELIFIKGLQGKYEFERLLKCAKK